MLALLDLSKIDLDMTGCVADELESSFPRDISAEGIGKLKKE